MKKFIVILLAAVVLFASGCAKKSESTPDSATGDEAKCTEAPTQPPATQAPTEPPTVEELAKKRYDEILNGKLKNDYAQLDDIEAFDQTRTGMQAACEALALTAALNHFGYDLDYDDIVDDYLVYDNNFVTGYVGNPRRFYDGSGIYPPGMLTTTWNFIEDQDAKLYPFDTTGLGLSELYKFVDAGCPVLVWTTYDRYRPRVEQTREYEGVKYPWYDTEHCVCLFGYHLGDNEVKIADSWGGVEKWEDADRFEDLYDEIGQFSMVLMDTSKLK